ncbi:MAG: GNAT family N-acetyltransferase, partial [Vagococcus sp.]
KALLEKQNYEIKINRNEQGELLSFIAIWQLETSHFIEHLAVSPLSRGGGVGGKIMKSMIETSQKPILLEVEHPETEIAKKRIQFYERLGFHLNTHDYVQPPIQEGESPLPLHIMSYPNPILAKDFSYFKEDIFSELYTN